MTLPTPSAALAFLRAHWRAAACVVALLLAFLLGRGFKPQPRIEYKDRIVTQVQWKDRIVEKTVTVTAKSEDKQRVTHRVETTRPDGSRVVELDTATGTETKVNVGQLATVSLVEQGTSTATRETSVVQTPAPLPRWKAGGLVGLSTNGTSFGAEGGLRVVGPLWLTVGGFVGVRPMAFAGVGVEW